MRVQREVHPFERRREGGGEHGAMASLLTILSMLTFGVMAGGQLDPDAGLKFATFHVQFVSMQHGSTLRAVERILGR